MQHPLRTVQSVALAAVVAASVVLGFSAFSLPGNQSPALAQGSSIGNLFTGTQTTFLSGPGTWVGNGATLAALPLPGQGIGELQVTATGAAGSTIAVLSGGSSATWTPAVPGARYSAAADLMAASSPVQANGLLGFYAANGTYITGDEGQLTTDSSGVWTSIVPTVALAPANAAYVVFAVLLYNVQRGQVQYLSTPDLTQTIVTTARITGPLYTLGNGIYENGGKPIVFHGVYVSGSESSTPVFPTDAEIGQLQSWGANFVRVPLNESDWVNTCTASRPSNIASYPASVDAEVNSITSRGMVALLDLHMTVISTCGTSGLQAMADEQYAPSFWAAVAARYKSNPLVAFDLFNEPHNISDLIWDRGGHVTTWGNFQAAGMQQLYNTIRDQGATNLVFVSGNNYANTPSSIPLVGVNVVNAVHDYTCPDAAPPNCASNAPYNPAPILSNWSTIASIEPVMLTEGGWPDPNNGAFNQILISDVNALGWGWSIFSFDAAAGETFDLVGAIGSTWEPSPAGMPVLVGLEQN
jgi:aryl-phospho-beta-D-glucosidase BglC (GH1 family)